MYNSPHWFNPAEYWIGYPHILISGWMKWYYLAQLGFWIQQYYVLHIEKRRKDHYAMLSHHVITFALLLSSYCVNFTRIGNAVLCCMDFADILLPVSCSAIICIQIDSFEYLYTVSTACKDSQLSQSSHYLRYCIRSICRRLVGYSTYSFYHRYMVYSMYVCHVLLHCPYFAPH